MTLWRRLLLASLLIVAACHNSQRGSVVTLEGPALIYRSGRVELMNRPYDLADSVALDRALENDLFARKSADCWILVVRMKMKGTVIRDRDERTTPVTPALVAATSVSVQTVGEGEKAAIIKGSGIGALSNRHICASA